MGGHLSQDLNQLPQGSIPVKFWPLETLGLRVETSSSYRCFVYALGLFPLTQFLLLEVKTGPLNCRYSRRV